MNLSVTKVSTLQDCPRKYWYSYVGEVKVKKSEGFFFGSAVHEGLENYYNGKDPMDAVKICLFGKKENVSEEAQAGVDPYKLLKDARKIFDVYKDKAPDWKPMFVELMFDVPIVHPKDRARKLSSRLVGKIDLVTINGEVVDHKTGSGGFGNAWVGKNMLQSAGYIYWYWHKFKRLPSSFIFNNITKATGRKEVEVNPTPFNFDEGTLVWFFDQMERAEKEIANEHLDITIRKSHCRYCQYKDICQFSKEEI